MEGGNRKNSENNGVEIFGLTNYENRSIEDPTTWHGTSTRKFTVYVEKVTPTMAGLRIRRIPLVTKPSTMLMLQTIWVCLVLSGVNGYTVDSQREVSRRTAFAASGAFLASVATGMSSASAQDEIEWTAFNGLIFNYRGGQYGGLDGSTLTEPSVPFREFGERLKNDEVAFVEFMAPDGDKAYVTFKPTKEGEAIPKPIRIGDGYPIEQHDGWSSPAFVVRAVTRYNVPYKFTVPGLAAYSQ